MEGSQVIVQVDLWQLGCTLGAILFAIYHANNKQTANLIRLESRLEGKGCLEPVKKERSCQDD